jgi:uncharacterized membrane protein
MFEIEHIHPVIVHFVIAPLIIAITFDFLWLFKKNEYFQIFSWYNLNVAGIFGVLSVISGLMAEENVIITQLSKLAFEYHENLAFIFIIFLIIQLLWRFGLKGKYPEKFRIIYFLVVIVTLVSAISTGYLGGKLVFEYGIGIKSNISNEKIPSEKNIPKFQFIKPDTTK